MKYRKQKNILFFYVTGFLYKGKQVRWFSSHHWETSSTKQRIISLFTSKDLLGN